MAKLARKALERHGENIKATYDVVPVFFLRFEHVLIVWFRKSFLSITDM